MMKVITKNIDNKNYSQIFIFREDINSQELMNQIDSLKKNGNKVAIFISGNKDLLPIIKENIFYTFDNSQKVTI